MEVGWFDEPRDVAIMVEGECVELGGVAAMVEGG